MQILKTTWSWRILRMSPFFIAVIVFSLMNLLENAGRKRPSRIVSSQ
jgi:hypothetical protein